VEVLVVEVEVVLVVVLLERRDERGAGRGGHARPASGHERGAGRGREREELVGRERRHRAGGERARKEGAGEMGRDRPLRAWGTCPADDAEGHRMRRRVRVGTRTGGVRADVGRGEAWATQAADAAADAPTWRMLLRKSQTSSTRQLHLLTRERPIRIFKSGASYEKK
jgi:hypothetical protein